MVNSANNSLRSMVRVGCGAAIEGDIEGGSRGCRRKQKHTFASTLTQLENNLISVGDIPTVDVVIRNGNLFCRNNRRLGLLYYSKRRQ